MINFPARIGLGAAAVACALLAVTAAPAAAESEYVLVNANADGDTPVTAGVVRVHRCNGSRPLRQSSGASGERAYRTGVTLLEFERLPRCFVVSVTGGRANGRPLGGTFFAEARDESARLTNVSVTPVTTLAHRLRQANPRLSGTTALRRASRRLKIPDHYDRFDLQADDRIFDGDRFLRAARRAGGTNRLMRELVRDSGPRAFHHTPQASAAQAGALAAWWDEFDVTAAAVSGLKDFGASFLWDQVVKPGGQWVLGRFLDYYGLRSLKELLLPKSEMQKLTEMVQHLTIRINALEATGNKILREIAALKAQVAASPAIELLTHIDTNHNAMQRIAQLNPAEPGIAGATNALLAAIQADLNNRNLLDSVVAGRGGAGLLVQESKRAATAEFFTPADSKQIRDVYDYYVLYQLRFANLLTELWNTQSCSRPPDRPVDPQKCLAPATIAGMLDEFRVNIEAQQRLLKPPVPAGRFVDVKRHQMWVANPPWVSGADYKPREESCVHLHGCGWMKKGWRNPGIDLAGESELRDLISSVPEGNAPFEFLVEHAGFIASPPARLNHDRGFLWLGTGGKEPTNGWFSEDDYKPVNRVYCVPGIWCHQRIERVNLRERERPGPYVVYNRLGDQDPQYYWAHALPRPQPVAPGSYWHE